MNIKFSLVNSGSLEVQFLVYFSKFNLILPDLLLDVLHLLSPLLDALVLRVEIIHLTIDELVHDLAILLDLLPPGCLLVRLLRELHLLCFPERLADEGVSPSDILMVFFGRSR